MARRIKQKRKHFGSRTWGGGNKKNRRGKGSRGGKGLAGISKHRKTFMVKYMPDHLGRDGFASKTKKLDAINVADIGRLAANGKLEEKSGVFSFSFDGKVLGAGTISAPVQVTARKFSKSAEEKIAKAGGSVSKMGVKE